MFIGLLALQCVIDTLKMSCHLWIFGNTDLVMKTLKMFIVLILWNFTCVSEFLLYWNCHWRLWVNVFENILFIMLDDFDYVYSFGLWLNFMNMLWVLYKSYVLNEDDFKEIECVLIFMIAMSSHVLLIGKRCHLSLLYNVYHVVFYYESTYWCFKLMIWHIMMHTLNLMIFISIWCFKNVYCFLTLKMKVWISKWFVIFFHCR